MQMIYFAGVRIYRARGHRERLSRTFSMCDGLRAKRHWENAYHDGDRRPAWTRAATVPGARRLATH